MSQLWIFWLVLAVVFSAAELATAGLISIWFSVGSLAAMLTSLVTSSFTIHFVVFVIVSAISLILFMKPLKALISKRHVPTNADSNIGRIAMVIEPAKEGHLARVHLDGVDWSARCAITLTKGMECRILSISGATLTVEPVSHAIA